MNKVRKHLRENEWKENLLEHYLHLAHNGITVVLFKNFVFVLLFKYECLDSITKLRFIGSWICQDIRIFNPLWVNPNCSKLSVLLLYSAFVKELCSSQFLSLYSGKVCAWKSISREGECEWLILFYFILLCTHPHGAGPSSTARTEERQFPVISIARKRR